MKPTQSAKLHIRYPFQNSSILIIIMSTILITACGSDGKKSDSDGLLRSLAASNTADTVRAPESSDALAKRCELIQNRGPAEQAAEEAQESAQPGMGNRPPNAGRPGSDGPPGQNRTPPGQEQGDEEENADNEDNLDQPGESEESARIECPGDKNDDEFEEEVEVDEEVEEEIGEE
ncbi:MAG: hypothetical protein ACOH5I_14595 [Oligoflexus sp.]